MVAWDREKGQISGLCPATVKNGAILSGKMPSPTPSEISSLMPKPFYRTFGKEGKNNFVILNAPPVKKECGAIFKFLGTTQLKYG